jgi:hypothetical protein
VNQANRHMQLRFPYDQRPLLGLWRAFSSTGSYQPDPALRPMESRRLPGAGRRPLQRLP